MKGRISNVQSSATDVETGGTMSPLLEDYLRESGKAPTLIQEARGPLCTRLLSYTTGVKGQKARCKISFRPLASKGADYSTATASRHEG